MPVPEPVALGRPAAGFPWPWSVYRWIKGEPACLGQVTDLADLAADLAAARRFGWRYSPRQVISRVIADHARA